MRFLLIFLGVIMLTACGKSEESKLAMKNANLKILSEKYVKLKLKDPEAAQFRSQFIGKAGAPCGEVNAKNGFGAYAGFQRYIVAGKELTVLEADMVPGEFNNSWGQLCR